jgi:purine-binding chemotaxis protein CheW
LSQSQILLFQLAGESYAFDVLKAREVLTLVKITPLPSALDFLSGVINLRGSVIPVVNLRKKFGLPVAEDTIDTSIIIVEIKNAGETTVIGAVVDAVKGVMLCEEKDLEAPPRFGMQLNTNLVQAIAKRDGAFIVILDTNRVFSEEELWLIRDQAPEK